MTSPEIKFQLQQYKYYKNKWVENKTEENYKMMKKAWLLYVDSIELI